MLDGGERVNGFGRDVASVCLVTVLVAAGGCADDGSVAAPTPVPVAPELLATLDLAIQDEYRAEAIYQGVVDNFGQVLPFASIINAEVRHSTAIARLFSARGVAVPTSQSSVDTVPHFGSVQEACVAGVVAENENIALYDELLTQDLPNDVRQVFMNNRRASLENHLPAFVNCS